MGTQRKGEAGTHHILLYKEAIELPEVLLVRLLVGRLRMRDYTHDDTRLGLALQPLHQYWRGHGVML